MTKGNGKAKGKKAGKDNGQDNGVRLVPQEHGGALNSGGTPGHKGGPGRPPNELRGTLRDLLEQGLPTLAGYIEGRVPVKMVGKCEKCGHEHEDYELLPDDIRSLSVKDADRLKAMELAARYGGVDKLSLTVDEQPEQEITPERVADMWERLQRIKSVEAFEKMLTGMAAKQLGGG